MEETVLASIVYQVTYSPSSESNPGRLFETDDVLHEVGSLQLKEKFVSVLSDLLNVTLHQSQLELHTAHNTDMTCTPIIYCQLLIHHSPPHN